MIQPSRRSRPQPTWSSGPEAETEGPEAREDTTVGGAEGWALIAAKFNIPAEEALELAELALFTARKFHGDPMRRARTEGFCWSYVAKARRAGGDREGAEEAMVQAWELWKVGEDAACELLPEERLRAIEAALG